MHLGRRPETPWVRLGPGYSQVAEQLADTERSDPSACCSRPQEPTGGPGEGKPHPVGRPAEPGAQRPDPAETPREGDGAAVTVGDAPGGGLVETRREPGPEATRDAPRAAGRRSGGAVAFAAAAAGRARADCAVGSGEWAEPPHSPWTLRRRGSKMAIFWPFFDPRESCFGRACGGGGRPARGPPERCSPGAQKGKGRAKGLVSPAGHG